MAAQMWEGRIKGAEASDACLRKERLVVISMGCKDYDDGLGRNEPIPENLGKNLKEFWKGQSEACDWSQNS